MALFHTTVVDNQIKALSTIGSVSGAICTFDTDKAERLVNLEVAITATQSGSGTPSPSNPRTINGFSACDLVACGSNIWDEIIVANSAYNTQGQPASWTNAIRNANPISVKGGTTYYFKFSGTIQMYVYWYNGTTFLNRVGLSESGIITAPNNATAMNWNTINDYGSVYNYNISINCPSTDTSYHAYNGTTETIPFGQTVYGGRLNVGSGVLTVNSIYFRLNTANTSGTDSGLTFFRFDISANQGFVTPDGYLLCNMFPTANSNVHQVGTCMITSNGNSLHITPEQTIDTLEKMNTFLSNNNVYVAYKTVQTTEIQLDSKQIQAIIGTNSIYADTGDIIDLKFVLSVGKAIS